MIVVDLVQEFVDKEQQPFPSASSVPMVMT